MNEACPQGHAYTEANTYLEGGRWRRCRTCMRDRHRAYQQANPEQRASYRKRYRAQRAEYLKARPAIGQKYCSARRARKRGAFVEFIDRRVVWTRDGGICGVCHAPADQKNWHLDHVIPLARGGAHSYANTQVTHPACNWAKAAA